MRNLIDSKFDKTGEIMQAIAKIFMGIGIIANLLGGAIMFFLSLANGEILIALLYLVIAAFGCLASCISSIPYYALGELLLSVQCMEVKLNKISSRDSGNKEETANKVHKHTDEIPRKSPVANTQPLAASLCYALRYTTDEGMIGYLKTVQDPWVQEHIGESPAVLRKLVQEKIAEVEAELPR